MKNILDFMLKRAKERSTWMGLISILSAVGLTLKPEAIDAVIAFGMAAAGLIAVVTADKPAEMSREGERKQGDGV